MIFKPAARREYDDAYDRYAASDPALGRRFESAIEAKVDEVDRFPTRFPVVLGTTREAIVPVFPYSIIFRRRGNTTTIVAVYHHSRKPFGWRRR